MLNRNRLIKLYKSGLSIRQIAKKVGYSQQYVYLLLKGHVKFRKKIRMALKLEPYKNKIVKMVKKGCNIWDIAEKFKVAKPTVFKTLKRWGLKAERKRRYDVRKLIELYKKNFKVKQICKKLNITPRVVYYMLHKLGVRLRSKN